MRIHSVAIQNFRCIRSAKLVLPDHAVLIGDNNTGKSSVFEAIDLVLGPGRSGHRPPVGEHDFYQGKYLATPTAVAEGDKADAVLQADAAVGKPPKIIIDVTIVSSNNRTVAMMQA